MMCCYYPTTTIAIDDDVDFLRVISQHLGIADCIPYSSPSKVIDALKNTNPFNRIASRIVKTSTNSDITDDYAVQINMRNLHHEIYSNDRFNDVSVLIIDYHMDEMTGIEVCEALKNHPAKKILLTGSIDKEKIAIEAFNKGIIHRFINKSDANFPILLKQAVSFLKENYFRDLTSEILTTQTETLLHNPAYVSFTRSLKEQFDLVEFYLIDVMGSKVFLNSIGNPIWLVIRHDDEIENYINIAKDQDGEANLIESLTQRKMIPFFFSEDDFQQPVSKWNNYLYQAYPFPGITGYYYAVIEGQIKENLNAEKMISYRYK